MVQHYLPFEQDIEEAERELQELELSVPGHPTAAPREVQKLRDRLHKALAETYGRLTPWQKTLVARHPDRPQSPDYLRDMCEEFMELHGDRSFGEDPSIVGGFARLGSHKVLVLGHSKGKSTKERVHRNFGMSQPEGYRKALRLFRMAERFRKPIVTLVDTPGAYPGIEAEERGQAEAIAHNIRDMFLLKVPIVTAIIGEGGSGGALAIAVADRLIMLEHSVYSVISPEACVAILWKNGENPQRAAEELRLTAQDLLRLGVTNQILTEPTGGAHRDPTRMARELKAAIVTHLDALAGLDPDLLVQQRLEKFRQMGHVPGMGRS
ncbi:MAG: acetyl-CoA carboxylase carboxyltransferase subunit alpha [Nitrospirae bacterium]|nr:acetyl-CoA carboxylase carboxyltransferase subunit alpha [Nitrospirota bacterium]